VISFLKEKIRDEGATLIPEPCYVGGRDGSIDCTVLNDYRESNVTTCAPPRVIMVTAL